MFTSHILKAAHTLKAVHGWAVALKIAFKDAKALILKAKIDALKAGEQIQVKFWSKKAGEVIVRFATGLVAGTGIGRPSPSDSIVFTTPESVASAKFQNIIF